MFVQNLVPIGPQATTCIPSEGYTHTHTHGHTHTLLYRYRWLQEPKFIVNLLSLEQICFNIRPAATLVLITSSRKQPPMRDQDI